MIERLRRFITSVEWRFAKTMPHTPHWYCLRAKCPHDEFEAFIKAIREYGYNRQFKGREYICLDIDGYSYWTMGAPARETILINRAKAEPYHTALKGGCEIKAEPIDYFEYHESIAMKHDIMGGRLPEVYQSCDVFYVDPPWKAGLGEFNNRAGAQGNYDGFLLAMQKIISHLTVPVICIGGKIDMIQGFTQALPILHRERPANLYVYHAHFDYQPQTSQDMISWLAQRYSRVGDFCCGYGLTGRLFAEAGKSFVLSDYNAQCIGYIAMNAPGWFKHENLPK